MKADDAVRERIAEHQEALEAIADSDLPADWVAEALIEVGGQSRDSPSPEEP